MGIVFGRTILLTSADLGIFCEQRTAISVSKVLSQQWHLLSAGKFEFHNLTNEYKVYCRTKASRMQGNKEQNQNKQKRSQRIDTRSHAHTTPHHTNLQKQVAGIS